VFLHLANQHIKSWIKSALIPAMVSASVTHTVLLRTDGNAVAVGDNGHGRCNIPALDEGMLYTQISAGGVMQCFCGVMAVLLLLEIMIK